MLDIAIGCLAFVFIFFFDFNKIWRVHKNFNLFFAIGILMLIYATVAILLQDPSSFALPPFLKMFFILLAILSLAFQIHALFFALPFQKTYINLEVNQVIDTGLYALCRHPGVIGFLWFYLFMWLATGKMLLLLAAVIWTCLDILHISIQDRWLFPRMLTGYRQYKATVPFLIPTKQSIKRCFRTIH